MRQQYDPPALLLVRWRWQKCAPLDRETGDLQRLDQTIESAMREASVVTVTTGAGSGAAAMFLALSWWRPSLLTHHPRSVFCPT
jgi:hypothetical protein